MSALIVCFFLVARLGVWSPAAESSQPAIPIRELSAADKRSPESFGSILEARQLSDNTIMVNDPTRRRVVILDSLWSNVTVALDSSESAPRPYGPRALQLIAYTSDSSLRIDAAANAFLVMDAAGNIVHVMAPINSRDFSVINNSASYSDLKGNLLYRGRAKMVKMMSPLTHVPMFQEADSTPLLRSNFETRAIDTVGNLRTVRAASMSYQDNGKGGTAKHISPAEPLVAVDDWAVLADGSIAIIRGGDYHVEIISPDGARVASSKLPFDWKRVTDAEKIALIDSATGAALKDFIPDSAARAGLSGRNTKSSAPAGAAGSTSNRESSPSNLSPMLASAKIPPIIDLPKPQDLADYYPSIRQGAAKPDRDGNLWILPTTSAQSRNGELIYDVVNSRGELFERVRIPSGRSIAAFGKNGGVYLMVKEADGWYLERTTVKH